ncbi:MAG: SDR family oxidoreductase [Rhodobacteraceae bacterium]|nr:SDR family oxidoreductase [Paracoccaceae bacterium]
MTGVKGVLAGKVALVTGASGTIGHAIAVGLAAAGADVALHFHTKQPETGFAGSGRVIAVQADLGASGFEKPLLDEVEKRLGCPGVLVNCAANQDMAVLADMPARAFSQMMSTNVGAAFSLSREFANRQKEGGAIVNISSIEARRPALGHGAYATSKAALEMLTRAMALEFGPVGLRVNAIAPGLIEREGIKNAWPDGVSRWQKACPLGRMGRPEDIAEAAVFLASRAAGFVNGTVLTVDGGMSVVPGW